MISLNYSHNSPYSLTPIIGKYMAYYVHRSIPAHSTDRFLPKGILDHRYVNRPDNLAFDLYGDWELFWVIPVRNGFQDPIFDLKKGVPLWIPDPNYVKSII